MNGVFIANDQVRSCGNMFALVCGKEGRVGCPLLHPDILALTNLLQTDEIVKAVEKQVGKIEIL